MSEEKTVNINGEELAKIYKFFAQFINPRIIRKIKFNQISAKGVYSKHQNVFDKAAKLFNKYNINPVGYVKWIVNTTKMFESRLDENFITRQNILSYMNYLAIHKKREKIYKMFLKSVDNIVEDCIKLQYTTVQDYFRYLISNNKLAAYYIAGRISDYYLASIPTIKKIILKLDPISKDEFRELFQRFESYNIAVTEAFLQEKNIKINPIEFTNDKILEVRNV